MKSQIRTLEQLKDSRILYEKSLPSFGYLLIIIITIMIISIFIWCISSPKIYMIKSTGVVKSSNKNYVMSPYTGEIVSINIAEGTSVEQGDVLFTVKSTDLDLQSEQLVGQKDIYETQITQYQKLVQSIQNDTNYFDQSNADDSLYYSQYEAYKSQVAQQKVDTSVYESYGYTAEQIEGELLKGQNKISEIYYTAIQSAENSILECQKQLDSINAQLEAVESGQSEYAVTANATGIIHMTAEYQTGMVVQAAAAIASIASEQDEYVIEAYVSPSDTARINVGDTVDIAISGLTQSVYGTITGEVMRIDSDITMSDSENDSKASSYFKVAVKPDYTYLVSKEGDKVNISNGMAVETRIQYDKVTYFNYVLEALGVLTR